MKIYCKIITLFFLFIFISFNSAFSEDYQIEKVEINGNKRIPASFISNITNKYINKKI